jgi:hypothetical protein
MGSNNKPTESIIKLINAGADIAFDASDKPTEHLIMIVTEAAKAGVKVTLKDVGDKPTENLLKVIAAGKGNVVIEL